VELDAALPEGTSVTVIAPDDDGTFTADPATEKMLLESIAQCDQGQTVDINSFSPTCTPRSERPAAGISSRARSATVRIGAVGSVIGRKVLE